MVVQCEHLHHKVANKDKGFVMCNEQYWKRLHNIYKEVKFDILMGDFNMSLFKVIPELRSRGVVIDLLAYYPWTEGDKKGFDSCGIFAVDKVSTTRLAYDVTREWQLS